MLIVNLRNVRYAVRNAFRYRTNALVLRSVNPTFRLANRKASIGINGKSALSCSQYLFTDYRLLQSHGPPVYPSSLQAKCFRTCHNLLLSKKASEETEVQLEEPEKLSLVKRYKKMLKEYWYVLIPVHLVTSTLWFGTFYYIAKSGFDIVPYLEMLNLPESIIKPLRNSALGYIAVASALYKIATPARYMVTLGGSTVAVKQLTKRGLIKPVPSKAKLKTMIKSKLDSKKETATKNES